MWERLFITDFGDQWDIHGKIEDEWTSEEKFRDHFGNIFDPSEINNKIVCDVGSGCGRIVKFISRHNPKTIYAVEPSSEGVKKFSASTYLFATFELATSNSIPSNNA